MSATVKRAVAEAEVEVSQEEAAKPVLALRDLEPVKAAGLNRLTSACDQRTYDHAIREFVGWYCSQSRPAFNRTSFSDNIPHAPAQQRKP